MENSGNLRANTDQMNVMVTWCM